MTRPTQRLQREGRLFYLTEVVLKFSIAFKIKADGSFKPEEY